MRIAYLFTTFPKISESFLQREVNGLANHANLEITLFSFLGGRGRSFNRFPLQHFRWKDQLRLPFRFLIEICRKPDSFLELAELYDRSPPKCPINLLENLVGAAFAITYAKRFRKNPPDLIHAVWATAPAAAALLLSKLNDIPFSMGAHAYDIHSDGGDCLLLPKIEAARFVHTSTDDARISLLKKGAAEDKVRLIRRGLNTIPPLAEQLAWPEKIRTLSVGRLIEKKGYFEQLDIYAHLAADGIPFEARIIGGGPLRAALQRAILKKNLQAHVTLCGALPYEEVNAHYKNWAQLFLFTGKIARSGDRDGFPNVIGEAMAAGVLVLTSAVAGTSEVIQSGKTGALLPLDRPKEWSTTIRHIRATPAERQRLRKSAHAWVTLNFNASINATRVLAAQTAALESTHSEHLFHGKLKRFEDPV